MKFSKGEIIFLSTMVIGIVISIISICYAVSRLNGIFQSKCPDGIVVCIGAATKEIESDFNKGRDRK